MYADDTYTATRRALHAAAELLLAGPQHAVCGRITLRPVPGGFGTTHTPDLRVEGTAVVAGDRRAELGGRSARSVADELGITTGDLSAVYADGAWIGPDDILAVDAPSADRIAQAFALGDAALRAVAPGHVPVLWPEHFDLAVTLDDERVNLGVSPGDSTLPEPYMYVGPWDPPPTDEFWNQPFGVAHALADDVAGVVDFLAEARARIRG